MRTSYSITNRMWELAIIIIIIINRLCELGVARSASPQFGHNAFLVGIKCFIIIIIRRQLSLRSKFIGLLLSPDTVYTIPCEV